VWSVLRHPNFRRLWLGQAASVFGDALVVVGIGIFVTRHTGSSRDVGFVLTSYALPLVLFLVLGGVVADRLPRRTVMIASDLVRGSAHGLLAILIATGVVQIWHMVVIGAVYGSAEAFFRPAYSGLVPQTVPESEIQHAQALAGVSNEVAMFASPAVATVLLFSVGPSAVFAVDAVTFAISASLLCRVAARTRGETAARTSLLREMGEGWRAVRERAWVWATVAGFSIALLTGLAPFFVLGAQVAHQVYGSSAVYGVASAAWGLGTAAGTLAGGRWRPRFPMRAGLIACAPWPAVTTIFALGPPLPVLYAVIAAGGLGLGLFIVWWETALAERIPPHLLSRVSAWDWMGSMALLPLGYVLAGPLGQVVGDRTVLVAGGIIGVTAVALALLPRETRQLRRLPASRSVPVDRMSVSAP